MNSTVTRILELKFMVDTAGFDSAVKRVTESIKELRTAMGTLGKTGISISNSFNQGLTNSLNKTTNSTRTLGGAVGKTHKQMHSWFLSTQGGIRIFGQGGTFTRAIAVARNYLLLFSFAFGSVIASVKNFVAKSVELESSMVGVANIAKGMGYSVDEVTKLVRKFSDTGLITVKEAANSIKMLISMQGMNLDLVEKTMEAAMNWASFNRLGQYTMGEAIAVFTRGLKEQRSQVTDAIGWVTNLDNAWKKYAATIGTTSGKLSEVDKNVGGVTVFLQESFVVAGNAAKALGTYGGIISKLRTTFTEFGATLGNLFLPVLGEIINYFTPLMQRFSFYLKVNKDILALKVKEHYDFLVFGLKEFWSVLNVTLIPLLKFVAANKELVALFVSFRIGVRIFSIAQALGPILSLISAHIVNIVTGVRSLTGAMGALRLALGMGTFGPILAAITAIVGAFLLLRKRIKDVTQEALKANAVDMQRLRIQLEQYTILRKVTESELNSVRAKIASGKASVELKNREGLLVTQLEGLEKQIKKVNFELERSEVIQSRIKLSGLATELGKPEYKAKPMGKAVGIPGQGAVLAYDIQKQFSPIKELYDSLNMQAITDVLSFTSDTSQDKWKQYRDIILNDIQKIDNYGITTLQKLSEQDSQRYQKLAKYIKEIFNFVLSNINTPPPDFLNPPDASAQDAMNRWLEALREMQQETKKLVAIEGEERKLQEARNKIEDILLLGKAAKVSAQELQKAQGIFNEYMKSVSIDYWREVLIKNNEAFNNYLNKMREAHAKVIDDLIQQQEKFKNHADDLFERIDEDYANTSGVGGGNILKLRNELNLRLKELDDAYKNEKDRLDIYLQEEVKLRTYYYKQMAQEIINVTSAFSAQVIGAYVTERSEIQRTRDNEIEDLRRQLNQGVIDTQEFANRRNQIMANADIQMANSTRQMWLSVSNSVFSMMGEMLSQYVAKVIAAKVATNSISATTGLFATLGAGLGIGALVGLGGYLASTAFAEKPTTDYQDIYPSGASSEQRKRYGSLASAPIQYLNITPTVNISDNNTVMIAAGSVESFEAEVSELMKRTMQAAIDNQEIDLTGVNPR